MNPHLDAETLAAYVDGRLTAAELGTADRHIDACGSCRTELSALAAVHTTPAMTTTSPPPDRLGRYVVMRELGRGATGVVLRAVDPELDRAVAIKVLHDFDAYERLRGEAQAMAKLAHPNVVAVYDVGADAGAVFVAMELIDGDTLRGFSRDRGWRDVLAACISAGRGLAAAHVAGLVHRDVKPENVLCGADGRVAVSDFGLARRAGDDDAHLAGTPAYMAPEVYRGEPATAASDQFGFCATTFEMLAGRRAFAGDDLRALRDAIVGGERRLPPSNGVPAHVWRALARGLATDPAKRFPTMTALLDTLAADPIARRRRWIASAVALTLAVGLGAALVHTARDRGASCEIDSAEIGWDRGRVDTALRSADGDVARIDTALDAYATRWVGARKDACEATRTGTDSEQMLDARDACLDRARRELGALVDALATPDREVAGRAIAAIYALRDPTSCRDDLDPPKVLPQRDELDRAEALEAVGRHAEADAIAAQVIASLPPAVEPKLAAQALALRGRVATSATHFDAAGKFLYDALAAAERAHDDRQVASIWIDLIDLTGSLRHDFEGGTMAARAAAAAMARIDAPRWMTAWYAETLGLMLEAQGNNEQAREQIARALAIHEADRTRIGKIGMLRGELCTIDSEVQRFARARDECTQALRELESGLGRDDILVGQGWMNLAMVELGDTHIADAEAAMTHALAIIERHPDSLLYAVALARMASVHAAREDYAGAEPLFVRARDRFAASFPTHPLRSDVQIGLADVAYNRGDFATAIRELEAARAFGESLYTKDSVRTLSVLTNLSHAYSMHRDFDKASAVLDDLIARATAGEQYAFVGRALETEAAIADEGHDPHRAIALRVQALAAFDRQDDPSARAWTEQLLGDAYLDAKDYAHAIDPLERALAYYERTPGLAYEVAGARYSLARALFVTGRDRKRAVALARQAKADVTKVTVRDAATLAKAIDDWLADPGE